jgi:uncharacterized RDD family membrane protein YckC
VTKRPISRLSIAIVLGFVVVLAQMGAFAVMGLVAWREISSPTSTPLRFPLAQFAHVFRGELVFPVSGVIFRGNMIQAERMNFLRAVDLQTGKVRDFETPNASIPIGVVTNGARLWCFCGNDIFEFDGATLVQLQPQGAPRGMDRASDPFIYEGKLALIDRDKGGHYRVRVLVEGTWEETTQIALPGQNRTWAIDDRTGDSVLVPRTSVNSIGTGATWNQIHVIQTHGQYHLFHNEVLGAVGTKRTQRLSQRIGFDFVSKPANGEPASALVPENAMIDTAGWVLLDSKFSNSPFQAPVPSDNGLLFAADWEVWRQIRSEGRTPSTNFDSVGKVDAAKFGWINMACSADAQQIYVIANNLNDDMDLYRLDEGRLRRLPFRIEGMTTPAQRWIAKLFVQGLVVVLAGSLLLISLAAIWTHKLTYSFGHDSVELASLRRRAVARGLDLLLICGPLAVHSLWVFRFKFHASIIEVMAMEDLHPMMPLIPAAMWLGLIWIAFVITSGVWGVTPGKWLCNVRVVRTTLRQGGILRTLLRELLLFVDAPQFLTAIPGVLCLIVTENRQRIGDLVAGTLVINATKSRAC